MLTACSSNNENDQSSQQSVVAEPQQSAETTKAINNEMAKVDSLQNLLDAQTDSVEKTNTSKQIAKGFQNLSKYHKNTESEAKYLLKEAVVQHYDLKNVDEAFGLYKNLADKFPESEYAGEAEFQVAMIIHQHYGDINKAVALLSAFVEKHPNHERAPMAKQVIETANKTADELMQEILKNNAEKVKAKNE
ncbi:MAG: tetratricopeptide repeat protein [Bacteroidetes bacterium]|nr:tetratricopeptide repeat protein [Bacteroidota bacterium]